MKKFFPINKKLLHFYHGGDYNPEQWLKYPEVLEEDIRLMKLAGCNVMTIGVFSWAALEPQEGKFDFQWMDKIVDKFYENDIYVIIATPSGARPAWMSKKYPEVLRVNDDRNRILHSGRHNHCYTSPVYREKVQIINRKLAERYANHPALIAWHISNEYGGECHCELCQKEFRQWLKEKYQTLDNLNHEWWLNFWSHKYTDWEQIESPSSKGEGSIHGLNLDWKRFVTDRTFDFMMSEIKPLKKVNPNVPVTTNFMGLYDGLNYWKLAKGLDVISWDNYPTWHKPLENGEDNNNKTGNVEIAIDTAFVHDVTRSIGGGKPFMLMESTPSMTNWQEISKLKKPGMHLLSSLQAVAHGSDTVQYFQWRKSRGSFEKFHGAVVDHCGHENTRVFREVSKVGESLKKIDEVLGTAVKAEVGIIFDWENRWAMEDAKGPRNIGMNYEAVVKDHYRAFWKKGVCADIIDMNSDFSKYKLLAAPMLYMIRPGVAERIEEFVRNGGVFVSSYWSGIVNENDLCFLGGFPGPLRKVLGIWSEEIDSLYGSESNSIRFEKDNELNIAGSFRVTELCDLIHTEGANALAVYEEDFYESMPALTVNNFGKGKAYYIAARTGEDFYDAFYKKLMKNLQIRNLMSIEIPYGVTVQTRTDGEFNYNFLMNFNDKEEKINLENTAYYDLISQKEIRGEIKLPAYGVFLLKDGE